MSLLFWKIHSYVLGPNPPKPLDIQLEIVKVKKEDVSCCFFGLVPNDLI